ncbi:MAG TPA: hypothetical protein VFY96_04150 [Candidatus Binatia bacterium]|nr:hypothetical protein [Candidatus Binatia bacterium]
MEIENELGFDGNRDDSVRLRAHVSAEIVNQISTPAGKSLAGCDPSIQCAVGAELLNCPDYGADAML